MYIHIYIYIYIYIDIYIYIYIYIYKSRFKQNFNVKLNRCAVKEIGPIYSVYIQLMKSYLGVTIALRHLLNEEQQNY